MTVQTSRNIRRLAFSLVELLVSMALIVFIMTVLSAAFSAASKSVRDLKAAGDNAERLRGAVVLLRRDLKADHFMGQKRLSDQNFWKNDPNDATVDCPPREGFFRLWQEEDSTNDAGFATPPLNGG